MNKKGYFYRHKNIYGMQILARLSSITHYQKIYIFFYEYKFTVENKTKKKKTKKRHSHQASRHLRMSGTNLKTIKFNNI